MMRGVVVTKSVVQVVLLVGGIVKIGQVIVVQIGQVIVVQTRVVSQWHPCKLISVEVTRKIR